MQREPLIEQVNGGTGQHFFGGKQILAQHGTQKQLRLATRLVCANVQSHAAIGKFQPLDVDQTVNACRARAVGEPIAIDGFGKRVTRPGSTVQGRVDTGSAINRVVTAPAINRIFKVIAHDRVGCRAAGRVFVLAVKPPQTDRALPKIDKRISIGSAHGNTYLVRCAGDGGAHVQIGTGQIVRQIDGIRAARIKVRPVRTDTTVAPWRDDIIASARGAAPFTVRCLQRDHVQNHRRLGKCVDIACRRLVVIRHDGEILLVHVQRGFDLKTQLGKADVGQGRVISGEGCDASTDGTVRMGQPERMPKLMH